MAKAQGTFPTQVVGASVAREEPRIVGRIRRPRDRVWVFFVESRSSPGRIYRVEVRPARLVCPCLASVYTGRCAHRAAVRAFLLAEREAQVTPLPVLADAIPHDGILRREAFSFLR